MSEPQITLFRARTGYDPIDAVKYRRETVIDPYQHRETDILFYRMIGNGAAGKLTQADRAADDRDLLFISPGTGHPASGHVGGARFKIEPSQAVRATFVPRGADTSVTFVASASSTNLMFPSGYLDRLMSGERHGAFNPHLFIQDERLTSLTRMLESEIASPGFVTAMMVEGLSRAIASLIVRLDHDRLSQEADRIYLPAWKIRRVDDFINAHINENIRLGDLAALTDLSLFHFSRVFKLATGSTPYHYVCQRRIAYSCQLLANGELDMAHIAAACGFANQSHFTSAFSKAMGISPGRYRRNLRFDS
ncbi:MAG: helix-turn-helix transcriptional regulator [Sphingomonas sp.]|uniref:helix-turn-helix domain-containing protein n=1 Tax=Sphingomonas sp. TaxID=28214 RepID=UPI0018197065|nr:helix-turn-helix transcriptional regulator [Sphingomonas sp.]